MNPRTHEQLAAGLDHVRSSPRDEGRLAAIVVRPERDARRDLASCRVDPVHGLEGDRWIAGFPSPPLPGMPDQDGQVTLANSRAVDLVAGTRERWALAGDQLYLDFDLSEDNLRAGDRLRIGEAVVLEITARAHNGCRKFAARYGEAALAFVNSPLGRQLHLRGLYARVVVGGTLRVGDAVRKVSA
jgi:hypothetical protein